VHLAIDDALPVADKIRREICAPSNEVARQAVELRDDRRAVRRLRFLQGSRKSRLRPNQFFGRVLCQLPATLERQLASAIRSDHFA
jgi:hypothetical protein